jgi:hypothetical protein
MKSRNLNLTLASLRTMQSEKLVAMRGDVEKALSEKRVEIERCLSEIDGLIPRVTRASAADNRETLH